MKKRYRAAALVLVPIFFSHAALGVDAAFDFADPCCYLGDIFSSDAAYQEQDALYQALLQACETVDESSGYYTQTPAVGTQSYDMDMIFEVAFTFKYEHPEYFWLGNGVSCGIGGVSLTVAENFQSGDVRQEVKAQIAQEVQTYLDEAQQYGTLYEKARYFHDALIQRVDYQQGSNDQNIASVFLEKQTVCAGYSAAYNLLCNAAGMDTVTIVGMNHAWNAVKLDNCWFLTDVTFDKGMRSDTYFFLSSDEMRRLDEWEGTRYDVTYTDKNGKERTETLYEHDPQVTLYCTTLELLPGCSRTYAEYLASLEPMPGDMGMGDVNQDGRTDAVDASLLLAECALRGNGDPGTFTAAQLERGDYNGDGEMNAADASEILHYAALYGNRS